MLFLLALSANCIVCKGKVHIERWYEDEALPEDWRIEVSDNGWTTDAISLHWLKHVFISATEAWIVGRYHLLVLDGYGSHLTPESDGLCGANNIISICMPANSSHLLQSLDVACFPHWSVPTISWLRRRPDLASIILTNLTSLKHILMHAMRPSDLKPFAMAFQQLALFSTILKECFCSWAYALQPQYSRLVNPPIHCQKCLATLGNWISKLLQLRSLLRILRTTHQTRLKMH